MKYPLIWLLLLSFSLSPISADERSRVWERIYTMAAGDAQRAAVLENIRDLKDLSFVPFYQQSLTEVLGRQLETGSAQEVRDKVHLAKMLVQELGQLRAREAAPLVFRVYSEARDPFLKGEAALALGRMTARDYLPTLIRNLADLNLPASRTEARPPEIQAYALVQTLDLMADPSGYEVVFSAARAWYSPRSGVRELARQVLKSMIEDPTDQLIRISQTSPDLGVKLQALQAGLESNAPGDNRNRLARSVLTEALARAARDRTEAQALQDLRLTAVRGLMANQDKSLETVPLLGRILEVPNLDENERLTVLEALGANGTERAAEFVASILSAYNVRQTRGLNREADFRAIRQILASLARLKSPLARPPLMEMRFVNYTPALVREAEAVLSQLP